jgi:hypothetical protein
LNRQRPSRNWTIHVLETLDNRIVPSGLGVSAASIATQETLVATKADQALGTVYTDYVNYENSGHHGTFQTSESSQVAVKGTSVSVAVQSSGGNFNALEKQLKGLGVTVTATAPKHGIVDGEIPIAKLPAIVALADVSSTTPIYKSSVTTQPVTTPTSASTSASPASVADVTAKGGPALGSIYQQYLTYAQGGSQGTFTPTQASQYFISGTSVKLDVSVIAADKNVVIGELTQMGMQIEATTTPGQVAIVEGFFPIVNLPTAAANPDVVNLLPVRRPSLL